jgi:hypothetical protein
VIDDDCGFLHVAIILLLSIKVLRLILDGNTNDLLTGKLFVLLENYDK